MMFQAVYQRQPQTSWLSCFAGGSNSALTLLVAALLPWAGSRWLITDTTFDAAVFHNIADRQRAGDLPGVVDPAFRSAPIPAFAPGRSCFRRCSSPHSAMLITAGAGANALSPAVAGAGLRHSSGDGLRHLFLRLAPVPAADRDRPGRRHRSAARDRPGRVASCFTRPSLTRVARLPCDRRRLRRSARRMGSVPRRRRARRADGLPGPAIARIADRPGAGAAFVGEQLRQPGPGACLFARSSISATGCWRWRCCRCCCRCSG